MTVIIGLTGSIAMGKSTIAKQFAQCGAKVSDADALVHQLFEEDASLKLDIKTQFPSVIENGKVNRQILGKIVFADEAKLKQLENLLHPKVRAKNLALIEQAKLNEEKFLLLEIPLLFETKAEQICDIVVVVSCGDKIQRERALSRPYMTEEKFEKILSHQMPDAEKRKRADYIIDTSKNLEDTKIQIQNILRNLEI